MRRTKEEILAQKKVAFLSLGCKVNSYETEGMRELFLQAGAVEVPFEECADIYLVNTCSVTNIADRKSRQMLHRARKQNPDALVIAAGCYAQAAGETLGTEDGVDLVVGNNRKAEITELVADVLSARAEMTKIAVPDIAVEREYEELPIAAVTEHTRAFIKIEDGCNQFCSYCIIPYVRGRVRSRKEEEVLAEVKRLAEEGYREIVLTGIHLSSYGLEKKEEGCVSEFDETLAKNEKVLPLLSLIQKIAEVEKIERIRLGSLEPRIMTEEFVKALAGIPKLCPHFHLSLQSGCDATLKRMNRKYTTEEYSRAVDLLREYLDRPAITTDIIVGFPGETEEEFEQTLAFAKKIEFAQIHIFKYSRRKNTVADRMKDQLPETVKSERSNILSEAEQDLERKYRLQFVGETEKVLLEEEVSENGEKYYSGHTGHYTKVLVSDEKGILAPNQTVRVRIDKVGEEHCYGTCGDK